MIYKHQWRRESSAYWSTRNVVPSPGEPILETDTGRFKVGDGETAWNDLPYFTPGEGAEVPPGSSDEAVNAHINAAEPHPAYDDGPSLSLLYQNAKV